MARVIQLTARLRAEHSRQQHAAIARQQAIDELVVAHMEMVDRIARQVWSRYTRAGQNGYSSQIEISDMVACGYVGLVEAARRYQPSAGEFPKFAYRRIRGAMIDAHRRGAYRDMQHESVDAMMQSDEMAAHDHGSRWPRFELEYLRDPSPQPDQVTAQREVERLAVRAIRMLPDDERLVIIDALKGADLEETAATRGRSVAWARAKLTAAREKVATMVAREQRAA